MDPLVSSSNLPPNADPKTPNSPYTPGFALENGTFYQCYDKLAEEIDDNMVKGLKEHLDGLLIFVSG